MTTHEFRAPDAPLASAVTKKVYDLLAHRSALITNVRVVDVPARGKELWVEVASGSVEQGIVPTGRFRYDLNTLLRMVSPYEPLPSWPVIDCNDECEETHLGFLRLDVKGNILGKFRQASYIFDEADDRMLLHSLATNVVLTEAWRQLTKENGPWKQAFEQLERRYKELVFSWLTYEQGKLISKEPGQAKVESTDPRGNRLLGRILQEPAPAGGYSSKTWEPEQIEIEVIEPAKRAIDDDKLLCVIVIRPGDPDHSKFMFRAMAWMNARTVVAPAPAEADATE